MDLEFKGTVNIDQLAALLQQSTSTDLDGGTVDNAPNDADVYDGGTP